MTAAPATAGVYRLYRDERVIFIGLALDLRSAIEQHRQGQHGPCTRLATRFDYELTQDPVSLHRKWLAEFAAQADGRLPECNELGLRPR